MILLDDVDQVDNDEKELVDAQFGFTRRRPASISDSLATLPVYERSVHNLDVHDYPPTPPGHPPSPTKVNRPKRWGMDKRLWRAAMVAFLAYLALTLAIGIPVGIWRIRSKATHAVTTKSSNPSWNSSPFPQDLFTLNLDAESLSSHAVSCNTWGDLTSSDNLSSRSLSFSFPMNGSVFIRSNVTYHGSNATAPNIRGTLLLDIREDLHGGQALVDVTARYSRPELLNSTSVCLMKAPLAYGLVINVPNDVDAQDLLEFDVHMSLPKKRNELCDGILTNLPYFEHQIGDLSDNIFNQVVLQGPGSPISADAIHAGTIGVFSALADVSGNFCAFEALQLETIGGAIRTNVTLISDGITSPTYLMMKTGDGEIFAEVELTVPDGWSSSALNGTPDFQMEALTCNQPMSLAISHSATAPVSIVKASLTNSRSQTMLKLDPRFAGSFDVASRFGSAMVLDGGASEDAPDVDGRWFAYELRTWSEVSGWVGKSQGPSWSGQVQGTISIASSLGSAVLDLQP